MKYFFYLSIAVGRSHSKISIYITVSKTRVLSDCYDKQVIVISDLYSVAKFIIASNPFIVVTRYGITQNKLLFNLV